MIKQPSYLKKNDKIAIVCPANYMPKDIDIALTVFTQWGLRVVVGKSIYARYHQFAGDDALRTEDLQYFLDDPDIKAIIAGRGGYGTIRIIDNLDFSKFITNPKWIVGFSDITVLLSHLFQVLNMQSIHGTMPYVFDTATPQSLESLRKSLFGETISYSYKSSFKNRLGSCEGILIGGNLTLLVMVEGSVSEIDYTDKILFIEEVGEREAAIDRMMRMLKRSGKLARLKGLIVGAFSDIQKEPTPYGQTVEELIWDIVKEYDYPVCFNFPVGHIDDNRAMVIGKTVKLLVNQQNATISL